MFVASAESHFYPVERFYGAEFYCRLKSQSDDIDQFSLNYVIKAVPSSLDESEFGTMNSDGGEYVAHR
jgi:hypothetical protein